MSWSNSRNHHSSPNHHEILVNGNWVKKRNEDHDNRTAIEPLIKDHREIDVYEPTAADLILNRLSIALNSPNLDPYNPQYVENFHIIEKDYIPYTFFRTEKYEVKSFNTNKRLIDAIIFSPNSEEELKKLINGRINKLLDESNKEFK
jgi:hypothetical protein